MNVAFKHLEAKLRFGELSIGQWASILAGVLFALGFAQYLSPVGGLAGVILGVYLGAIPQITDDTVSVLLKRCGVGGDTVLSRLATTQRTQLADALDAAAATLPTR